jgi:modulator of FtsH protease
MQNVSNIQTAQSVSTTASSSVLRNTYLLLSLTLAFSALTAGISMAEV